MLTFASFAAKEDTIPLTTGQPGDIEDVVVRNLFECNATQGMISVSRLCDGNQDCPYGEDEISCGNNISNWSKYL